MSFKVAVFSIELFTPTAKFIKRDLVGLNSVSFFAHKKRIPSNDFKDLIVHTPGFNVVERVVSFFSRTFGFQYYFMSARMKRYYLEEFQKQKIELVIAHFGPSGIDILDICRMLNLPLIVVFHGYDISKLIVNKSYLRGLNRLNQYHKMNARAVAKFFLPVLSQYIDVNKIFIIPNGVEVGESFNYVSLDGDIFIIQAANLVEKKGIEYSIMAVIELIKLFPNKKINFDICGDGPLMKSLVELVGDKYRNNIRFHGHLAGDEFKNLMTRANIFLHPSVKDSNGETETIPTSILEAMSMGKIVVTTIHAGIPEVILNGFSGFMVAERSVVDLVSIMSDLVERADYYNYISVNAHEKIRIDFNLKTQYKMLSQEITRLVCEE